MVQASPYGVLVRQRLIHRIDDVAGDGSDTRFRQQADAVAAGGAGPEIGESLREADGLCNRMSVILAAVRLSQPQSVLPNVMGPRHRRDTISPDLPR